MFVKLKENQIEYAPYEKDGVINYNAESNAEQLIADGYKVLVESQPSDDLKLPVLSYTEDEKNVYQVWSESPVEELNAIRIAELKQLLADSDWAIVKIAEGSATHEQYAELIEQRKAWRAEINALEG